MDSTIEGGERDVCGLRAVSTNLHCTFRDKAVETSIATTLIHSEDPYAVVFSTHNAANETFDMSITKPGLDIVRNCVCLSSDILHTALAMELSTSPLLEQFLPSIGYSPTSSFGGITDLHIVFDFETATRDNAWTELCIKFTNSTGEVCIAQSTKGLSEPMRFIDVIVDGGSRKETALDNVGVCALSGVVNIAMHTTRVLAYAAVDRLP